MRTFTREQLMELLELHRKWARNEEGGQRADLSYANLSGADLSGADLSGADLSYANLSYANLSGADLSYADLSDANLSDADLRRADLSDANLSYADLRRADLSYADLSGADLRRADLSDANLSYADLRRADLSYAKLSDADLRRANLSGAKEDLFEILDAAPREVDGLLKALKDGKVDGSTYRGDCCCLVGTIANVRGCSYDELNIKPDSSRPAERWFMGIRAGQTPENHQISKITVEWVEEWLSVNAKEDDPHEQSQIIADDGR